MRLVYVSLFTLMVLGCQAPTANISPTEVVAAPVARVDPPAAVAAGRTSVWGEVPKQCA
jgi:hypothetical protein